MVIYLAPQVSKFLVPRLLLLKNDILFEPGIQRPGIDTDMRCSHMTVMPIEDKMKHTATGWLVLKAKQCRAA